MSHWYGLDGNPMYSIVGANGKERATTLRDARKLDLVPSVTTIMKVAAAPALETWKINKAIQATRENPDASDNEIRFLSSQEAKDAASRGTEIHDMIEQGFKGESNAPYEAVRASLSDLFPEVEGWVAEESFASPEGYGGKIDLYHESGIIVDFKTKDNLDIEAPMKKLVFDNHGIQLSAYAQGIGMDNPTRVSVFVDREDPTKVVSHILEDTHVKHLGMFSCLLAYWKLSNNFGVSNG